jgi:hypothetical protein
VRFRFLQRPEYVTGGSRFVFREGRTKGIGVVLNSEHEAPPAQQGAEEGGSGSSGAGVADGSRRGSTEEERERK